MSKLTEILVATALPMIKAVGKVELESVLGGVKEHNTPEVYQNTLKGIHSTFLLLKDAATKTKTKIDDGIIDLILEAVEEKAGQDGVTL